MIISETPLELNPRILQICIEAALYAEEQYPDDLVERRMCHDVKIALLMIEECANNIEIRRECDTGEDHITFNIGTSVITAATITYPE
jgi:hypothetical protein